MRLLWGVGMLACGVLLACDSPFEPTPASTELTALTLGDGHGCVLDPEGRVAALKVLADQQKISVDVVTRARDEWNINPDKANPRLV